MVFQPSSNRRWLNRLSSLRQSRRVSSRRSRLWSCGRLIQSSGRCRWTPARLSRSRRTFVKAMWPTSFDRTAKSRYRHHWNLQHGFCRKNTRNQLHQSSGSRNVNWLANLIQCEANQTFLPYPLTAANPSPAKSSNAPLKQNPSPLSKPTQEKPQYDRPVPGSTLRCLDDPDFPDINSPPSVVARPIVNPTTTEVVDKARDRFDRFWGSSNEDQK